MILENLYRWLSADAWSGDSHLYRFLRNFFMTKKKWKNCTQRLHSAERKFIFVISVSCQQGDFEHQITKYHQYDQKNVIYDRIDYDHKNGSPSAKIQKSCCFFVPILTMKYVRLLIQFGPSTTQPPTHMESAKNAKKMELFPVKRK